MSESSQVHTIVCEEVFDENSVPSEEGWHFYTIL